MQYGIGGAGKTLVEIGRAAIAADQS